MCPEAVIAREKICSYAQRILCEKQTANFKYEALLARVVMRKIFFLETNMDVSLDDNRVMTH